MKLLILLLLSVGIYADSLVEQIKHHEGFRSKPYIDQNHYSIGYGINLRYGLTQAEAELLLIHRLAIVRTALTQFKWFNKLTPNRQNVLLNMGYQLGITGLLQFKHMIWALKQGHYNGAANAMVDSKWYRQSGHRAKYLVSQMRKG
jgi:lysozyme